MADEEVNRKKFEENIHIVLKPGCLDENSLASFKKLTAELVKEGEIYSLNRESFIKFFNELDEPKQREFLAMYIAKARTVYDVAQEYNMSLLQGKH